MRGTWVSMYQLKWVKNKMKICKWILGLFTLLAGVLAMFFGSQNKSKKIKELENKIAESKKQIKERKNKKNNIKKSLENKRKVLEDLKKAKEKGLEKKDVSADEAADFLKKYVKKKGK